MLMDVEDQTIGNIHIYIYSNSLVGKEGNPLGTLTIETAIPVSTVAVTPENAKLLVDDSVREYPKVCVNL